jgi:hypothetical protein
MKRLLVIVVALGLTVIGGLSVWAASAGRHAAVASASGPQCATSCEVQAAKTVAVVPGGKVLGHFDASVSGACEFSCATRETYDPATLVPQPGADEGQTTQCPVSGVVFVVDPGRPRVQVGADEYVTCCDGCARKLRAQPARFVNL